MPRYLSPAELSRQLRTNGSADIRRRRWIIGLSFAGVAIGKIVSLYQTGIIKRLPDVLPGKIWDAEKVDASTYAYRYLQMPDAPQMVVTYGLTAALASAGGPARSSDNPALSYATAGKAAFDLAVCLKLAGDEWRTNRKLCSWCQLATIISVATLALSLPEARRAIGAGRAPA